MKSTEFGVNDFGIPIIRFVLYSEWGIKEFFFKIQELLDYWDDYLNWYYKNPGIQGCIIVKKIQ